MTSPISTPTRAWRALLVAGAAFASTLAHGQHAESPAPSWALGVAASSEQQPYREAGSATEVLPMISYENRWLRVFGPTIDAKLPAAGTVAFSLRLRYADAGYEADDSPYLRGMAERKDGFWLGGHALWRNPVANVSGEWLADASGHSKGRQFKLAVDRRVQFGAVSVTPRIALNWQDKKYVDYYYGVAATEARSGRAAYTGSAAANTEAGVLVNYALAREHMVFLDLSATALGSSIKDSPLVERSSKTTVRAGYLYRF